MREVVFLNENKNKWKEIEEALTQINVAKPDQIAHYYMELTEDLSYAQTYYGDSPTTKYLNDLTAEVYQKVYLHKKDDQNMLANFFLKDLPLVMYEYRLFLLISFLFFLLAATVGFVSTLFDDSFVRIILGDHYVDMTINNINNNDPLGVYKKEDAYLMFLSITINNIKVSFYAYVSGIFFCLGTAYILFNNGVMLGAFQVFFYKYGLLLTSFLTIWIHGALEISAIVIAGCAGFVLGAGLMYPGTLPRRVSLVIATKKSIKILVGLIPIFITAGFLESYVTRHTEMPDFLKWTIILTSFVFIVFYFVLYPVIVNRKKIKQTFHRLAFLESINTEGKVESEV